MFFFQPQVDEKGFQVPLLAAGESGLVVVEATVPDHVAGTHVVADFEFVDSHGNAFGERLTLDLVVEPVKPPSTSSKDDEWEKIVSFRFLTGKTSP